MSRSGVERGATLSTLLRLVASQAGGRASLAMMRFGSAVIIMRYLGVDVFGQYALVMGYLILAEWLVDFGQTDIAVRQLAANPGEKRQTLESLALLKLIQGFVVAALLTLAIILMHGQTLMTATGVAAGIAVMCYAGVLIYRADLRARMRMDFDMGAEVVATGCLVTAIGWFSVNGAGIDSLIGAYAGSRIVHLLLIWFWSRPDIFLTSILGSARSGGRLLMAATPLGLVGLLAAVYEAMDAMALAHWSSDGDIGVFSAANRLVMLAVMVIQAVAVVVYPVLAAQWMHDRARFLRTLQSTLDASFVVAGVICCALYGAAQGIELLFKQTDSGIAEALRILIWVVFARVTMIILGQMVVVAGKQMYTLWLTAAVVIVKLAALAILTPAMGAFGAVHANLLAEFLSILPTIWLCQRITGTTLAWSVPVKAIACAGLLITIMWALEIPGTLLHGMLAAIAYLALAVAFGAIRMADMRALREGFQERRKLHDGQDS